MSSTTLTNAATSIIDAIYDQKKKRNIWENSKWSHIAELENDDVGKAGERIIAEFCNRGNIPSEIDGIKTKELGGGVGDGVINGKTVEIKTALPWLQQQFISTRTGRMSWVADYMIFLDIAPEKMYLTIFKNFTEEFYKEMRLIKEVCALLPNKVNLLEKAKGAFKLDTTVAINKKSEFTFTLDSDTSNWDEMTEFINSKIN